MKEKSDKNSDRHFFVTDNIGLRVVGGQSDREGARVRERKIARERTAKLRDQQAFTSQRA